MSWDGKRGTTRRYYYRHGRNAQGRAVKFYLGSGAKGQQAAQEDAEARGQRSLAHQAWLQQWSEIEQARQPLDEFCAVAAQLTKCVLIANGWYQHGGHEWRRRVLVYG
ncbi:MAG: hypothetical protein NTY19_05465 [Planctomycetota bacterium]|nr:hypothetical protein [Planctomycetota bacterium]